MVLLIKLSVLFRLVQLLPTLNFSLAAWSAALVAAGTFGAACSAGFAADHFTIFLILFVAFPHFFTTAAR